MAYMSDSHFKTLLSLFYGKDVTPREGVAMAFDPSKIERIVQLARTYGATRLILFGSAMDAPQTARDIDIACDGVPGWKLFELAAKIEDELDIPFDIFPLTPATRFTQNIEKKGTVLL
jgi:predicted nucleotidyltransferase